MIEIKKKGYQSYQQEIQLKAGQKQTLYAKLKPLKMIISQNRTFSNISNLTNLKIELYQPTPQFLKQFEDIILIKGKILAHNEQQKQILTLLKNNQLILIPVIEGNSFYTYDNIPVSFNGNFEYSWPISADQINGRRFWLGIFDVNGIIKPRERYNISPLKKAQYVSEFIQFN